MIRTLPAVPDRENSPPPYSGTVKSGQSIPTWLPTDRASSSAAPGEGEISADVPLSAGKSWGEGLATPEAASCAGAVTGWAGRFTYHKTPASRAKAQAQAMTRRALEAGAAASVRLPTCH